jgi:hypothetical protein
MSCEWYNSTIELSFRITILLRSTQQAGGLLLSVNYRRPAAEGSQLFTLFAAQKRAFHSKGVLGWLDPMNEGL